MTEFAAINSLQVITGAHFDKDMYRTSDVFEEKNLKIMKKEKLHR
ncbi:hypothetical Protein YC6258_01259 [Gynuella sunshinyii YC6258]|uniref:Uncharacterized protein n=1 Tax=Gynuella sunshinyii YC6258 TaxID=1445510 RepID=A0A0C5VGJ7_9GAMM|nr:hypothetical Protein YC6258_01259 [Gynuella sunshinyii YC6258]